MLSISRVPTLVVIENKTGKVVTFDGMGAIEWSGPGKSSIVLESWRKGNFAIPLTAHLFEGCTIT